MKFSVIIPMEFHRGQGTTCVEAWCRGQDFPGDEFEVLCVMPRTYPAAERKAIEAALRRHDRLIESESLHDMAMCVEGAAMSKGENLFFTESHVWPEPGVLRSCTAVLEQNPDWAGFSCKTTRITNNVLAKAEADMYEQDINAAMNDHPWLKILDQCFVTRRNQYFATGGFDARLGHFAEWVLSEKYHENGFKIGYAPSIKLSHYYIGHLADLNEFTRDFIDGEIRYFSESFPQKNVIDPPPEWLVRGNLERIRARFLVKTLWRYGARHRRQEQGPVIMTVVRQVVTNLPGCGIPRLSTHQWYFEKVLVPGHACRCPDAEAEERRVALVHFPPKGAHRRSANSTNLNAC